MLHLDTTPVKSVEPGFQNAARMTKTDQISTAEEKLRGQRDRFVAFAFAGADVLHELDAMNRIVYSAGTTDTMHGKLVEKLAGKSVLDLVAENDRRAFETALGELRKTGRLDRMKVHFSVGEGRPVAAIVSGIAMPSTDGRIHLNLARMKGSQASLARSSAAEQVISKEDFTSLAEKRLAQAAHSGDDYHVTLLDLSASNFRSMGRNTADFLEGIQDHLRVWSIEGDSVGRIHEKMFGIIHDGKVSQASLEKRVADLAEQYDPKGGIEIQGHSMGLAAAALSAEDVSKAMAYTITRFVEDGGKVFGVKSLADGYKRAVNETLAKVNAFRAIIHSDKLTFVYQPIIGFSDWKVLRWEALARVDQGNKLFLPSQFVTFAEDLGVVSELDAVVVKRAIATLRGTTLPPGAALAVNVCARSFAQHSFVLAMFDCMKANQDVLPRLIIEITEWHTMNNYDDSETVLQALRSYGCRICLDDFVPCHNAFQILKRIEIDSIKIDGTMIRDAAEAKHGKAFLKTVAQLCHEMKIRPIGEQVEDEGALQMLKLCGVDHGQGWFFAKPMANPADLSLPAKVS